MLRRTLSPGENRVPVEARSASHISVAPEADSTGNFRPASAPATGLRRHVVTPICSSTAEDEATVVVTEGLVEAGPADTELLLRFAAAGAASVRTRRCVAERRRPKFCFPGCAFLSSVLSAAGRLLVNASDVISRAMGRFCVCWECEEAGCCVVPAVCARRIHARAHSHLRGNLIVIVLFTGARIEGDRSQCRRSTL